MRRDVGYRAPRKFQKGSKLSAPFVCPLWEGSFFFFFFSSCEEKQKGVGSIEPVRWEAEAESHLLLVYCACRS